ncbi:ABC transporter permease [[Pantoea] beijingensis]|uniref:ABC transporter permease n=1 Tax=[Pantoea] beijingensis TaxID=1324864 RepID=A0A443IG90_9GAMM|nr:branched-chain amino acid ABC transporter permease [[Pantoea] beijingensis]RWR03061.1 ABC transporter permease [[Pantoea] beijingensis]
MWSTALSTGLNLGSMYALLALGFHITWIVSRTLNFAQGSAMMVGATVCYTLSITFGWPLLLAIPMTLLVCALFGLIIERLLIHPFHSKDSDAWLMATVAGGILVDNIAMFTFGKEPRQFPGTDFSIDIFGHSVALFSLLIPAIGLIIVLLLALVRRYSTLGKVLEACVQNPRAARLMGIRVSLVIATAYAVSTLFAGTAGMLIAPLFNINSDMGTLFGLKAFAVAILGGLTSAGGIYISGLLFGLAEALVTLYFGSAFTQIFTFSLVIVALALRPDGLFGHKLRVKV